MSHPSDPSPELAALLRLKQHEHPPQGFFDDFARTFRERQRAESLRVSSWQLLADRFSAATHGLRFLLQPRCLYPLAAAALLLISSIIPLLEPSATASSPSAAASSPSAAASSPSAAASNPSAAASNPSAQRAQLGAVAALPAPSLQNQPPTLPRGALPVSTNTPSPETPSPNGLRRTIDDALIPALPTTQEGQSIQAHHGKTIILVR